MGLWDGATGSGVTISHTYLGADTYSVKLAVTDDDGATDEDIQDVTVTDLADTMHIGDLDGSSAVRKKSWKATVTITIHDADHKVVADATVTGIWNDGDLGEATCITSRKGKCKVSLSGIEIGTGTVEFTVTNVTHSTWIYLSSANHDPDGDSDGTNIIITK
ncbi:MAG: hypothetical protein GTO18_19570 [Anaerolineales bacterium]|nr:hypothetical protein [Anaerolineales bacterium]